MKSCSCPIPSYFIATDLLPSIFLRDLSKFLINFLSFGSPEINMKVINISNEASDGHMMRKNCLCTRAILKRKCGFCIIILELSLENRIHAQGAIVSCRIWQSIQSNKNSLAKVSMAKMEKKSDLLKDLLNTFQAQVGLYVSIFNLSVATIKHFVQACEANGSEKNIITLLRQITTYYPSEIQIRLPRLRHNVFRRKVLPEQFVRGSLLSSFSTEELLVYMCTNRSSYGMKKCSETEVCLTMNIEEKDFSVTFFLMLHEKIRSALDLFMVCRSNGQYLERIVQSEDGLYLLPRLDKMTLKVLKILRECLNLAAERLRRDKLWDLFSRKQKSVHLCIEDLTEFCSKSYLISMTSIDSRLKLLFHDHENDLQFNWSLAFQQMRKDPIFSHSHVFPIQLENNTVHLFRFKNDDAFVMFKTDDRVRIQNAHIIVRECNETSERMQYKAIETSINWILHWAWNSFW